MSVKKKMPRQKRPRTVTLEQAPPIITTHTAAGTCPNCGRATETFFSVMPANEPGVIQFGCPECALPALLVGTTPENKS